jgi:hypothetical protein
MKSVCIRLGLIFALCVVGEPALVIAQDSLNISRVGQTMLEPLGNSVAVSGNYAYVAAAGNGLQVMDISSPTNPVHVNTIWDDVALKATISGNYLYVGYFGNGSSGMRIYSLASPTEPALIYSYTSRGEVIGIVVSGNYAYVTPYDGGLDILNVSSPSNPSLVGSYSSNYIASPKSIVLVGNDAYIADGDSGLVVLNVTNPGLPQLAGALHLPGRSLALAISGQVAYVSAYLPSGSGVYAVDVTNPSSPAQISFTTIGLLFSISLSGNYLYIADQFSMLRVFNVTNPSSLQQVGFYDTPGNPSGLEVMNGYLYVSDFPWFGIYHPTLTNVNRISVSVPSEPVLEPAFPNPFNNSTEIRYRVAKTSPVTLKIFDVNGREVATLVDLQQNPGEYQVHFDAQTIASGTYFAQLKSGESIQTQKMILLK